MIVDYRYAVTVMWAIFCAANFRIGGYKISLNLPLLILTWNCTGKSNFEMFTVWLCICCEVLRQWIFQLSMFRMSFHAGCSSSFSTSCPCFCFTVVHFRFHATSPPYPVHLTLWLSFIFSIHFLWKCGCAPSCCTHISFHVGRGLVSKHFLEKFTY
jgi:hypothetical protein